MFSFFWMAFVCVCVCGPDGKVTRVSAVLRDTDRSSFSFLSTTDYQRQSAFHIRRIGEEKAGFNKVATLLLHVTKSTIKA